MEAVTKLSVDLPRIVVVEASEGEAVVEQHACVGDVERVDGEREVFSEVLAEAQVRSCVRGQIVARVRRRRILISV